MSHTFIFHNIEIVGFQSEKAIDSFARIKDPKNWAYDGNSHHSPLKEAFETSFRCGNSTIIISNSDLISATGYIADFGKKKCGRKPHVKH